MSEWILAEKQKTTLTSNYTGRQGKIIFLIYVVALKRAFFGFCLLGHSLLGDGVLGDGLGALRDGN